MADDVTLDLTIGEVSSSSQFASEHNAMNAVIDAFIANFPDEDEVFSLPEPVTEKNFRAFIAGLALDREFAFEIKAN